MVVFRPHDVLSVKSKSLIFSHFGWITDDYRMYPNPAAVAKFGSSCGVPPLWTQTTFKNDTFTKRKPHHEKNTVGFQSILGRGRQSQSFIATGTALSLELTISDFWIALAPQRGANFTDLNFKKCLDAASFLTILTFKSLSRHSAAQILATSRSWLSEPAKPQNFGKTQHFAQFLYPPESHTALLYHICAITSLGWQIFGGNSQYSRKLDP